MLKNLYRGASSEEAPHKQSIEFTSINIMTAIAPDVALTGRYNSNQAAAKLGIHRNTLRRIPESLLPRHQFLNGRIFFYGKDLQRYWHMNRLS